MKKENQFYFDKSNIKSYLLINVQDWNDYFEHELPMSCGEDLEYYMKLYFKKNWGEMFEGSHVDPKDVCDVEIVGIRTFAKNDKGYFEHRMECSERAELGVNLDIMGDENANKINEIRKIIAN